MHSLVSIVGVVLSRKENYLEWSSKIENTLIFNDIWDVIHDGDTKPIKSRTNKEISIWTNKDKKIYALITTSVSE